MLYHMLLHEVNGCDGNIVTNSGGRVHVENFVMRWGNFYLELLHPPRLFFLYFYFFLKNCKFVRNREKS